MEVNILILGIVAIGVLSLNNYEVIKHIHMASDFSEMIFNGHLSKRSLASTFK